jgi:hypothetical protein
MANIHNQTSRQALVDLDSSALGTGVFGVPDPQQKEFGAIKKVVIPSLTYDDCILRGFFVIAFKWVPYRSTPIPTALSECPLAGERCVDECAHDLCLCINGRCR